MQFFLNKCTFKDQNTCKHPILYKFASLLIRGWKGRKNKSERYKDLTDITQNSYHLLTP